MPKPDETAPTPTVDLNALEAELARWYGNLLTQLEPKVSGPVFSTLDEGRANLNRILNAARAARP